MNVRTHTELANCTWGICNLLRGPYKRNEYRKVILPLTVLRRFDCVLAGTKDDVLAAAEKAKGQSQTMRDIALKGASGHSFYNTSQLDFQRLLDDPNHIAQNLNAYDASHRLTLRDRGVLGERAERYGSLRLRRADREDG